MTNEKINLTAEKRELTGKRVYRLRKKGLLPGNIFGPGMDSIAVSVDRSEFMDVYKQAEETGVVNIKVGTKSHPVLIRAVQYHPLSDEILHIDFRKINLKEKIETEVPVRVVGDSPAVKEKKGDMTIHIDYLTIEALPQEIPSTIEVDISSIVTFEDTITVADIPPNESFVLVTDPETLIVSVSAHIEESQEPNLETSEPIIEEQTQSDESSDANE